MSQSVITQRQWQSIAELPAVNIELPTRPAYFQALDKPVESITWEEAREFCERLSRQTGSAYRLPTEAEWEYACRAGTGTPFHFGATTMPHLMIFDKRYPYDLTVPDNSRTESEGEEKTEILNAFGLHGMHGNVWEWCLDWFGDYPGYEVTNPQGPTSGLGRIIRGGSWNTGGASCRSACRGMAPPGSRSNDIGFRIVKAII